MRRKARELLVISMVVIIFLSIICLVYYQSTYCIRKNNLEDISCVLEERLGLSSLNFSVLCVKDVMPYKFISYEYNGVIGLYVFKQTRFLSNRFIFYGHSFSGSKSINTFSYMERWPSCFSMVVVYGNSVETDIFSYSITILDSTYERNVNSSSFIHIYINDRDESLKYNGYIYDMKGNLISLL
jgi:hypothetical protein